MVAKNSLLSTLIFVTTCFGGVLQLSFLTNDSTNFFKKNIGITMVNAQACARNYTVQPGDFCDAISAAQNVSTYVNHFYPFSCFFCETDLLCRFQLASVNKATIDPTCDNLRVGEVSPVSQKILFVGSDLFFILIVQVICLGLVGQDCTTVHVVQNGDSCPTIASQANITKEQLLVDNPNVNPNCTNIYPGEVKEFLSPFSPSIIIFILMLTGPLCC